MANVMGQTLDDTIDDIEQMLDYMETREVAVEKFGFEWEDFIHKKATQIVEEEIIEVIKTRMKSENFSQKIIDATYLDKVVVRGRGVSAFIKSDYVSSTGFPVSLAREYGTKRHWVQPLSANIQPIVVNYQTGQISQQPTASQQSTYPKALHWVSGGKHFFSKGHWVSGIRPLKIITKTIKEKRKIVRELLKEETKRWIDDLLS